MGLSGGKKKTKNEPWAPAQPYILKGMEQTSQVFDANQPRLQDMSRQAYEAFNSISPEAFQTSPFVKNAQDSAAFIGGGGLLGSNQGQATYSRLQGPQYDPSAGLLGRMATDRRPGAGSSLLMAGASGANPGDAMARAAAGGSNPGDAFASNVAGGGYLNNQPSSGMYASMMDPSYSTNNPFLESMIKQTADDAQTRVKQLYGSRGFGTGLSSNMLGDSAREISNAGNALRYQNYNDSENRRLQAGGQSDAAWSGERGRMDAATGLLSNNFNQAQDRMLAAGGLLSGNFNAGQDRALTAGQALNQFDTANAGQRLSAAQSLGSQYNAGQDRSLEAARIGDAAQSDQVAQLLAALGMTGDLRGAEFTGIAPALALLNTAADIPYVGTAALNGQIRQASNGYGTTTTSGGGGLLGSVLGGAAGSLGNALGEKGAGAIFSDRRLKTNIERVGALEDGLGIYEYDYVWGGGRQRGVIADEVARLRPEALGPVVAGYATVKYGLIDELALDPDADLLASEGAL